MIKDACFMGTPNMLGPPAADGGLRSAMSRDGRAVSGRWQPGYRTRVVRCALLPELQVDRGGGRFGLWEKSGDGSGEKAVVG